jgi:hypothetical protein
MDTSDLLIILVIVIIKKCIFDYSFLLKLVWPVHHGVDNMIADGPTINVRRLMHHGVD